MIRQMDEGIGRVMAALEARGATDDTIVVFTSDNGGERFSDNWPFVGQKMDLLEGGIRVPMIVSWPTRISPARTETAAIGMDLTATLLAAAGGRAACRQSDGRRRPRPAVRRSGLAARPRAFAGGCCTRGQRALRRGTWKYLRMDGHDYLFDQARDTRERANLAKVEAERLAAFRADWEAWSETLPPIPADARVTPIHREADMPPPVLLKREERP